MTNSRDCSQRGCRYLAASKITFSLKDAKAKGYTACKVCHPPEDHREGASAGDPGRDIGAHRAPEAEAMGGGAEPMSMRDFCVRLVNGAVDHNTLPALRANECFDGRESGKDVQRALQISADSISARVLTALSAGTVRTTAPHSLQVRSAWSPRSTTTRQPQQSTFSTSS